MPQKPCRAISSPTDIVVVRTDSRPAESQTNEQALLSAIVEASDDAILSKTLDGIIMTWNASAERMFGYSAAEIIGKSKIILFPSDRVHEETAILNGLRLGIPIDHFETIRLHKDGTPIEVSVTISPIKDRAGRIVAASTIIRDITLRKQAERNLLQSEGRLRRAVEGSQLGIWHWDMQADMQIMSRRSQHLMGCLDEGPVRGQWFIETIHPDDRERIHAQLHGALADGGDIADEFRVLWPDGSTHWLAVRAHGQVRDDGTPVRLEGSLLDITDNREREESLHRMLDSSPNCVNVLDTEARIVFMNEGGLAQMEVEDFALLKNTEWLAFWKGDTQPLARAALESARAGSSGCFQGDCPTVKGALKSWEVIVTPLQDAGGRLKQILVVWRDLTDQRRMDEQLKQNLVMIEQQNTRLESQQVTMLEINARLEEAVVRLDLAGVREHELREAADDLNVRLQRSMKETHHRVKNNLQVIVALADMQAEGNGLTVPASALKRITSHVRTLADLHDLLTQRTQANFEDDAIPTQEMLERLIFLLQPALGDRRIQYNVAQMILSMNQSTALSLLVSELVSNALKHGAGDLTLTFEHREHEARLMVSDQGKGFPPNFDVRESANTGLELIMSMARHDLRGEVAFVNGAEGGACVVVNFPKAAFTTRHFS